MHPLERTFKSNLGPLKFEQFMEDPKENLVNTNIENFSIIHYQCRGDKYVGSLSHNSKKGFSNVFTLA